jgi:hypothetical protein
MKRLPLLLTLLIMLCVSQAVLRIMTLYASENTTLGALEVAVDRSPGA